MHYSQVAGASDNRKRLSLASWSPGICTALDQPTTAMPTQPDPRGTHVPFALPQVLRGLPAELCQYCHGNRSRPLDYWRNVETRGLQFICEAGRLGDGLIGVSAAWLAHCRALVVTGPPPVCWWGQVQVTMYVQRPVAGSSREPGWDPGGEIEEGSADKRRLPSKSLL